MLICVSFQLLACSSVYGAVTARIDRTKIALDETLNLTINKDSSSFFSGPELAPLENDFEILGQNQSSSTKIINGSVSSSVQWNIVLAPKRIGTLRVPALEVGGERTQPLAVTVVNAAPLKSGADDRSVFLETDVDSHSVFVQAQLIYTLRVYLVSGIKVQDPGVPKIDDAVVEKLENISYDKKINDRMYRVVELRYAVFPQKSGVLEIPPMTVEAILPGQQRYNNFFGSFGSQGKSVRLRGNGEKVTVREEDASYPRGATWLPTESFSIVDEWSHDPGSLKVGESTTITIGMAGVGLLGTQLPPITVEDVDGVKLYQGKAEVRNHQTSDGITGARQESIALIPTKPGAIEFPEIRILWWDRNASKVEYAVIPARKMMISGEAVKNVPITSAPLTSSEPSAPIIPQPLKNQPTAAEQHFLWIYVSSALAIVWLLTFLILMRTRRKLAMIEAGVVTRENRERKLTEKEVFRLLEESCRYNDAQATRNNMIKLAREWYPRENIRSLNDVGRILKDATLVSLLRRIDACLYSQDSEKNQWQGRALIEKVAELRKNRGRDKGEAVKLAPLYICLFPDG